MALLVFVIVVVQQIQGNIGGGRGDRSPHSPLFSYLDRPLTLNLQCVYTHGTYPRMDRGGRWRKKDLFDRRG